MSHGMAADSNPFAPERDRSLWKNFLSEDFFLKWIGEF
jgi:hypothetical protein